MNRVYGFAGCATVLFALTWPLPINLYAWTASFAVLTFILACVFELGLLAHEADQ